MDVNNAEKLSTPSSLDVNKTETVATSSSGVVDKKSENVQDSKPASVDVQNIENGETKIGLDLQLSIIGSESNASKMKDESLTTASELVTKKSDKIPVASVLPLVNAEVKEFAPEQQNKTNKASTGTATPMKDSKNDDEQEALPVFSGSNDHAPLQNEAVIADSVPSEVKGTRDELPSENKKESDNLLTDDNEKQNSEENIDELSVTIPGLIEAVLEERWNECERLLKTKLALGCPEIKQFQYCEAYIEVMDKAVEKGFMDLIKLFIHNGYPCDTVLLYSLKYNREDIIYLAVQKGADVNCKGSDGETPLLLSAEKCSNEVMQLLISKGADISSKNNENESIFHYAAKGGNYNIVKLLLDTTNNGNDATLSNSIEEGNIKQSLHSMEVGINLISALNQSALHLSVENNHYNVAQLLLDRGADIDLKDNYGNTALHICCKHKTDTHLKVFTLLYERHANINKRNNINTTPLMLAVHNGNTSIAKCLLNDPYCDVEAKSYCGYTALDYARKFGNDKIIKLIETRLFSQ